MQKQKKITKFLSAVLCFVLIAVTALSLTACGQTEMPEISGAEATAAQSSAETLSPYAIVDLGTFSVGDGELLFTLKVNALSSIKTYIVHTDKTTVGEALLELGLISGEEGEYGLYVKSVDGITADFDTDGHVWAFYINGEYAMTGVDQTDIVDGAVYEFKKAKG